MSSLEVLHPHLESFLLLGPSFIYLECSAFLLSKVEQIF